MEGNFDDRVEYIKNKSQFDSDVKDTECFIFYEKGNYPEIRKSTPGQGGYLFKKFRINDDESFMDAAIYLGLNKDQREIVRKQAVEIGVMK